MPRSTPTTLALPPFSGATRRLILVYVAIFFIDAIASLVLPGSLYNFLLRRIALSPSDVVHGQLWQLATYTILPIGILGSLFAVITVWFVGYLLEAERGSRWLYDLFFVSAIGGAALASILSFTHLFGLLPASVAIGPSAGIFGLLVALALLMGDVEFYMFFLFRIKVKYLVSIYVLIDLATLIKSDNAFTALLSLCGGLSAFLFLRLSPRRGLTYAMTERWYSLRNRYYRSKRRRAARKFEVYMSKQGRQVHFDKEGKYIDPDKDPASRNGKDDKRWMN